MRYTELLKRKIQIAVNSGFDISKDEIHPWHKPHVKDIVKWAIKGGRRAVFVNFGMHKTAIQLEIVRLILKHKGGNAIIVCPLAVQDEFFSDAKNLDIDHRLKYITHSDQVTDEYDIYITNYERARNVDSFDPKKFTVTTGDEASVLRSLDSKTTEAFRLIFKQIPYRYIATATPAPNRFLELTHYADYLDIMDRGQILTRFFQRNSTKAGNLTLYERRETEFWLWVNSWAVVATKPSDINIKYSDKGYLFPDVEIRWHKINTDITTSIDQKSGQYNIIQTVSLGVGRQKTIEEKRTLKNRVDKMTELVNESPEDYFILWHFREDERKEIEKNLPAKTVYGNQSIDEKEALLNGFKRGEFRLLATKPSIAGSGCNFQYHCHRAIYLNVDDNFNDFIQSLHRILRYGQSEKTIIDIIYPDSMQPIKDRMSFKWKNHEKWQFEMTSIIRKYGLNSDLFNKDLKRKFFMNRKEVQGENYRAINNDNVQEMEMMADNSVGLNLSSWPFGNHYEYSDNFNCFGHNRTNEDFFKQMDFLTPHLYRTLIPGRLMVVHVKDRIRYSYQNGKGFTSIEPFSDHVTEHCLKHGFVLVDRKTITTDVVAENAQTYRLGWSKKCKDGSSVGGGIPEYLLIFRKPPTDTSNGYADVPVFHDKAEYSRGRWQTDAHAYWRSDGEKLFDTESMKRMGVSELQKLWKNVNVNKKYSHQEHVQLCENLDELRKLSPSFMTIPTYSNSESVWTDVLRMKTLNSDQKRKELEKHICPLQLDVCERIIEMFSNPGESVLDPFGGIMSVPYSAVKLGRYGVGIELKDAYWEDGCKHLQLLEMKENTPNIFKYIEQ